MSDRTTPAGGPEEHDAWLREALRHAPDASAAPPLSLRDAILAEARAAARTTPRAAPGPSLADRFAAFWSWLARPPVAAGFASVMAATLVGLMWWDRPLDETMLPPPAPVAASRARPPEAAAPAPVPAAPPATPAATTAERAATADRAPRRAVAAAPGTPAEPVATPAKTAATDALRDGPKDNRPSSSNVAPAAAPAPPAPKAQSPPTPFPARDTRDSDGQSLARSEPSPQAKKVEKNDAEKKREAVVSQNRLTAAAPPAPTGAAATGALDKPAGTSADASASGQFAAQPRPATAARQRAAEATPTPTRPMAPLLAALASEGARWTRPDAAGEVIAIDAAVQAWLGRVEGAASEWQPLAERLSRDDAARAADPGTLMLSREGRIAAIVEVEDAGVFFETRPGQSWFTPLAPDAVARLRATLPPTRR